jgi:hypothetical protein
MNRAADETAKIEHELDILRSRYAIFVRWARITKWYAMAAAVFATCLALTYAPLHDPLAVFVVAAMVIVFVAGLYLVRDRNWRWIDAVSPAPGWPHAPGFWPRRGVESEAIAIEAMIAEREKRLAEIKARPA